MQVQGIKSVCRTIQTTHLVQPCACIKPSMHSPQRHLLVPRQLTITYVMHCSASPFHVRSCLSRPALQQYQQPSPCPCIPKMDIVLVCAGWVFIQGLACAQHNAPRVVLPKTRCRTCSLATTYTARVPRFAASHGIYGYIINSILKMHGQQAAAWAKQQRAAQAVNCYHAHNTANAVRQLAVLNAPALPLTRYSLVAQAF